MKEVLEAAQEQMSPMGYASLASLLLYTVDAKMREYAASGHKDLKKVLDLRDQLIEVEADGTAIDTLKEACNTIGELGLVPEDRFKELVEGCIRDFPPE